MSGNVENTDVSLLYKFQAHVPYILIRHLVSNLILQYAVNKKPVDNDERAEVVDNCCSPSIQRFYCALLFVDISGFTALSTRLNVDKLRIQINTFFTKIIKIISKYNGDVLKFAGDALYVAWPCCREGMILFYRC